jgi:hypothetical protein
MDESSGVGVMKRFSNDRDLFGRVPEREAIPTDPDGQVAGFHQLRNHEARAVVGTPHVMDWHDFGMIQLSEDSGFGEKSFHILGTFDTFRVRHLDLHGAVKFIIMR